MTSNLKVHHHDSTTIWNTSFEGDITKVKLNGEELLQTHDLAKKTEQLSRQIRMTGVLSSTIAVVVLVLVSLIYQYAEKHHADMVKTIHARKHLESRLYEVSGNIWTPKGWVVDPKWQQNVNSTSSPSK